MIPAKVVVRPLTYTVDASPAGMLHEIREENDAQMYGLHDGRQQRITVDPERPRDSVALTLLHEVGHACFYAGGFNDHDNASWSIESLIRVWAPRFLGVLRDNPDLIAYLTEKDE